MGKVLLWKSRERGEEAKWPLSAKGSGEGKTWKIGGHRRGRRGPHGFYFPPIGVGRQARQAAEKEGRKTREALSSPPEKHEKKVLKFLRPPQSIVSRHRG